ncbi:hypothetical protein A2625_05850 [candidate division WOR-1 bacterium RIFCSPHIGHO2_01_FULL_53_15]|uniref:Prepilin leader peptidase/N-methyltransferase n=1 Tax=candidate division WOR-1 bacterium RIFCSPHIGHO2_01_FULL_53_15 TaxID=1802564 RepID=A0A1F4Q186_UNCSA|nr:MAG: hypothetical protein A2625_05850 [candidate division WOR-1 bacterium RIFCSPHIGHO2_01_FULL_53_15]OGC13881.1 MAG: hypothetical protein A3D23_02370 [candidate division WOR-1 bacterium RIFCSPHIGHO2_02_FULL_53_26]
MIYFWFILGLVVGSFLNVCIYRLPREESIIWPSSHCPRCGKDLRPLDLIPLISFFLLRGRCRSCGEKISPRYPLVELLTGCGFVGVFILSGGEFVPLIFQSVFLSALIVIFFVDLEHSVIPDSASYLGILAGLLYNFLFGWPVFLSALGGALLGYLILYLISLAGRLYYKKDVLGDGDLYLAVVLGAWLGWGGVLAAIFLSYLLAALVLLTLLLSGRVKFGQYVPFGPALAAGGLITLFFGPQLIGFYLEKFWL